MFCYCGQNIDSSTYTPYRVAEFDWDGNLIYLVCQHGTTVVDERNRKEDEL